MKLLVTVMFGILIITLTECRCKEYTDFDGVNAAEKNDLVKIEYLPQIPETFLEDYEKEYIARIVRAEAGNQDLTGKRLVVDCILNRVDDTLYPNMVSDVCLQNGQFVMAKHYTDEDMKAVEKELMERLDYNILYFRTKYYHSFGTPCFQHGAHFFSKR